MTAFLSSCAKGAVKCAELLLQRGAPLEETSKVCLYHIHTSGGIDVPVHSVY